MRTGMRVIEKEKKKKNLFQQNMTWNWQHIKRIVNTVSYSTKNSVREFKFLKIVKHEINHKVNQKNNSILNNIKDK